jgi:YHS domain-containing protein
MQDLVCRMDVNPDETRFFSEYNEETYYFCSKQCKRDFDDHPDNYIQQKAREEVGL